MKYGIEVPKSIEEARIFDQEDGNTRWHDAIDTEMNKILLALDILNEGKAPLGYTKSSGNLVYYVKMESPVKLGGSRMAT